MGWSSCSSIWIQLTITIEWKTNLRNINLFSSRQNINLGNFHSYTNSFSNQKIRILQQTTSLNHFQTVSAACSQHPTPKSSRSPAQHPPSSHQLQFLLNHFETQERENWPIRWLQELSQSSSKKSQWASMAANTKRKWSAQWLALQKTRRAAFRWTMKAPVCGRLPYQEAVTRKRRRGQFRSTTGDLHDFLSAISCKMLQKRAFLC